VAGPGWLGLAQPMWAELGPAPQNKKIKNKKIESIKIKILHVLEKKYFFLFIH
jgi:hypothetical protein